MMAINIILYSVGTRVLYWVVSRLNFNALVPELSVSDINISKEFYIETLGFKLEYERIEDKFAFISFGDAQIMLEQVNGHWGTGVLEHPYGRGINFQIVIQNIQNFVNRLKDKNVTLFREVFESKYKANNITYIEKEILLQDPDGYLLRFSETISERTV